MRIRSMIGALLAVPAFVMLMISPARAETAASASGGQSIEQNATASGQVPNVVVQPHWSLQDLQNKVGGCLSSGGDENIWLLSCDPSNTAQQWIVSGFGDGWYRIQNNRTKQCLDDSSLGVRLISPCWPGDDARSAYQKWAFSGFGDGYERLQNAWSRYCLNRNWMNRVCYNYLDSPAIRAGESWRNIL